MIAPVLLLLLPPLLGLLACLAISENNESAIARVSFGAAGVHGIMAVAFISRWLVDGTPDLAPARVLLYKSADNAFELLFSFDGAAAVYLLTGSLLTSLVIWISRRYMRQEVGFKRFSGTVLFFYLGYNVVILSANLEALFIGWEILAIASFLLIAFYRKRYLPVRNAVKFFSVYRVGDVGLLLAMWAGHRLSHQNISLLKQGSYEAANGHLQSPGLIGALISVVLLGAASVKSAQFPFSFWLARAVEAGNPFTAVLHASLSVHLGILLMLKTAPIWEHQLALRFAMAFIGLATAIVATGIANVQSSLPGRIAYASAAQAGLMFVEVAAGMKNLALFHFAGNALLRAYQLLVSPAIAGNAARQQYPAASDRSGVWLPSSARKIRYTFYLLSVKEWRFEAFAYFRNPLAALDRRISAGNALFVLLPVYLGALFCLERKDIIPQNISAYLPFLFSLIGLIMVLKSFTEHFRTRMAWLLAMMSHFWIVLAIAYNAHPGSGQVALCLSGVVIAGVAGYLVLDNLKLAGSDIGLDQFHGHSSKHPGMALIFLLCGLGVSGFPCTPAFIGERLLFSHVRENQLVLASTVALCLVTGSFAVIRMYALVFLGPPARSISELAYRSS